MVRRQGPRRVVHRRARGQGRRVRDPGRGDPSRRRGSVRRWGRRGSGGPGQPVPGGHPGGPDQDRPGGRAPVPPQGFVGRADRRPGGAVHHRQRPDHDPPADARAARPGHPGRGRRGPQPEPRPGVVREARGREPVRMARPTEGGAVGRAEGEGRRPPGDLVGSPSSPSARTGNRSRRSSTHTNRVEAPPRSGRSDHRAGPDTTPSCRIPSTRGGSHSVTVIRSVTSGRPNTFVRTSSTKPTPGSPATRRTHATSGIHLGYPSQSAATVHTRSGDAGITPARRSLMRPSSPSVAQAV